MLSKSAGIEIFWADHYTKWTNAKSYLVLVFTLYWAIDLFSLARKIRTNNAPEFLIWEHEHDSTCSPGHVSLSVFRLLLNLLGHWTNNAPNFLNWDHEHDSTCFPRHVSFSIFPLPLHLEVLSCYFLPVIYHASVSAPYQTVEFIKKSFWIEIFSIMSNGTDLFTSSLWRSHRNEPQGA